MTDLLMTHEDAVDRTESVLANLFTSVPMLTGSLLASADGRALAADLDEDRQRSAAAIVASAFALGQKLAELGGGSASEEMVIRHSGGYVAVYAVGQHAALVILTMPNTNLGMVKLKAAIAVAELAPFVPLLTARGQS